MTETSREAVEHPLGLIIRLTEDPDTGAWDDPTSSYARGVEAAALIRALLDERARALEQIEKREAKLAKAVEALSGVMVGGNHLALLLPDNFLPAETKPLDALDMMGAGDAYEVWCCWRSIMLARATLAELTGEKA